jgi:DNA-binding MarR family transcriptional regulator
VGGTAEDLLGAMAGLRRALRRRPGRPRELSELTGSELELVRLVRRRPGCSVAEAARELGLAANTVSTLVGRLTASGVLVRAVDDTDRRAARLDLSPTVRRRVEDWRDLRTETLEAALGRLSAEEQRAVEAALPVFARLAELAADE